MDKHPFTLGRLHDYLYDPNFIVSSKKDHIRHAEHAAITAATMKIAPVFGNMFSDLPNIPKQQIILERPQVVHTLQSLIDDPQPIYLEAQNVDPVGQDRNKFFAIPVIKGAPKIPIGSKEKSLLKFKTIKKPRNVGTQTLYRESSAQTGPWKTPHYRVMDGSDPEILKLNFLKENLPPGVHEVEILKKARKKRAWEKLLPDVEDEASLEKRRQILQAIETEEWAFREEEIQQIQNLRLELLEKMLQEILNETRYKAELKIMRMTTRLHNEHEIKITKMRFKKQREIRRLYRINNGISTKYHKVNVIDEHADYKSELYAPLMRFGEHPKRGHQKIFNRNYKPMLINIENLATLPRWLSTGKIVDKNLIKLPGRQLCIRETKWTEPILKQLHEELLNFSDCTKPKKCQVVLRKRIVKEKPLYETAIIELPSEEEDIEYQHTIMLQSIIRGRATQTIIYEGRDRCRELIEELQSTHVLVLAQTEEMKAKRLEVMNQQRVAEVNLYKEDTLRELLDKLKGSVVGTMLDYLNKELVRVLDERKAHALALLYERERRDKEAAEAGRRQVEERRRSEHDEIFKQVIKIHQETVDVYLKDIITEGIESVSDEKAQAYVKTLSTELQEKFQKKPKNFTEKEEIVSDMIYHYLVPEIEKQKLRDRLHKRQKKYLKVAHESIYDKTETLPKFPQGEEYNKFLRKSSIEMKLPDMLPDTSSEISIEEKLSEEEMEQLIEENESESTNLEEEEELNK